MSVQALPVRLAETLNRFGAAPAERDRAAKSQGPMAVVTVGGRSVVARVHGERVTRRGHQTLISLHGRLTWVSSSRVETYGEAS